MRKAELKRKIDQSTFLGDFFAPFSVISEITRQKKITGIRRSLLINSNVSYRTCNSQSTHFLSTLDHLSYYFCTALQLRVSFAFLKR